MAFGWTLVSILVALAFGGMAGGRDDGRSDLAELTGATDITRVPQRLAPPLSDDEYRAAV